MEKVILKLISELDFILYQTPIISGSIGSCRIQVIEQNKEAITGAKENDENIRPTIETLDKELPNMLAYCKKISSCPAEIKLLIKLFEGVINKYGLTKEVSYVRYHCAQLGEIVDDYAEIVSLEGTVTMELAESCKPWLYWLYKYYPKKEGDDAPMLKEMPRVLDTEPARKYFARAVEAGLMTDDYKWQKSKILLAVFCSKMSNELDLGKGVDTNRMKRISWKPFEMLFEVKGLRGTLNDMQKTGQSPKGIEKVDGIFKD